MGDARNHIRLPLDLLMQRLKTARFNLGQDTYMRVQEVLQKLGNDYIDDPWKLYIILAPVIAKSEAEQEKFRKIFEAYLKELEEQPEVIDEKPGFWRKLWGNNKKRLFFLVLTVSAAWLLYLLITNKPWIKEKNQVNFTIEAPSTLIIGDSFRVKTTPPLDQFADSTWKITWSFGDIDSVHHTVEGHAAFHAFSVTGNKKIKLEVKPGPTNLEPASHKGQIITDVSLTKNIVVNCRQSPPIKFVVMPETGRLGDTLRFAAETVNPQDSVDFTWYFGDRSDSMPGGEQFHVYERAGEYIISLVGKENWNCITNISDTVVIRDERNEVFRLNPSWINLGQPVSSFDVSSGNSHIYIEDEALNLRRFHMDGDLDSIFKPDLIETLSYSGGLNYMLLHATEPPRLNGVEMKLNEPLNDLQWFGLSELVGFNEANEIVLLDFLGQVKIKIPPEKKVAKLSGNDNLKEIAVLNTDGTMDVLSLGPGTIKGYPITWNNNVSLYTTDGGPLTGEFDYLEQLVDWQLPLPPEFQGDPVAFADLSNRVLTREGDVFRIYDSRGILLQEFPEIKNVAVANFPDYHLEVITADDKGRFSRYTPEGMVLPANEPHPPEYKTKASAILWMILLSFLIVAIERLFSYYSAKSEAEKAEEDSEFTKGPFYAELPVLLNAIHPEKGALELADAMRQRQAGKRKSLDILKTLNATVKQGGFPVLLFKQTSKPTEYLFLIDDTPPNSHQVRLFDTILKSLEKEDVLIDKFNFRRHPQNCWNPQHPKGISIEALFQKFPGHRLVIYSDGDFLMDDFEAGIHQNTLKSFSGWKERALLSSVPVKRWTYREKVIGREFTLMPSTLPGQLDLIEQIASESRPDFKELQKKYSPESASHVNHRNLADIKSALGDDRLATWATALAVYPKPSWEITLAIGQALEALPGFDHLVTIENLVKLSGLSFLKENSWPDNLRSEFLEALPFKIQKTARQAVIRLLHQAKTDTPENSMAMQELTGELSIQKASLKPPENTEIEELADLFEKGIRNDHTIAAFNKLERRRFWISVSKFIGAFIVLTLALTHGIDLVPKKWAYNAGLAEKMPFGMPVQVSAPDSVFTNGKLTLQINEDQFTKDISNREVVYFDGLPGELINESGILKINWDGREIEAPALRLTPLLHKFELEEIKANLPSTVIDTSESIRQPIDTTITVTDTGDVTTTAEAGNLTPGIGQNGKYGYKRNGDWVIEPDYDAATPFGQDRKAYVTKSGVSYQINEVGKCWAGCGNEPDDLLNEITAEKAKCESCLICVECIASVFTGSQTREVSRSPEICVPKVETIIKEAEDFAKASAEQRRISYCRFVRSKWNLEDRIGTRKNLGELISKLFGLEESEVTNDKRFTDLGMDALDGIQLLLEIERLADISIPDEAAERLKTVGDLQEYLVTRKLPPDTDADVKKIIEGIEKNMVRIPAGTFTMGCTEEQEGECEDDEKPPHEVTLRGFKINKYEVTQEEWREVMGTNWSNFKGCDKCPVESVSWDDAQEFIQKLNQMTGKEYRLPTEAEWEYAARGGENYKYAGSNDIGTVAWYNQNSGSKTHPVGRKKANGYGLFDMSGNVWEWCSDWYGEYESKDQTDPKGPGNGSNRVLRSGCWSCAEDGGRVWFRVFYNPYVGYNHIGFRLAHD